MTGMLWRPSFVVGLTILSGRSETEQGGYTVQAARRNVGKTFLLNEALDNSETGVDVTQGVNEQPPLSTVILAGTVVQIESEKMLVTSVSGGTLTVTRGYASTSAVTHATGLTVTVTTTGDGVVGLEGVKKGSVQVPASWTAADLTFKVCESRDGTYAGAMDEAGVLYRVVVGGAGWYRIPAGVFESGEYMRMVSTNVVSGAAVNQGADRSLLFRGGE